MFHGTSLAQMKPHGTWIFGPIFKPALGLEAELNRARKERVCGREHFPKFDSGRLDWAHPMDDGGTSLYIETIIRRSKEWAE